MTIRLKSINIGLAVVLFSSFAVALLYWESGTHAKKCVLWIPIGADGAACEQQIIVEPWNTIYNSLGGDFTNARGDYGVGIISEGIFIGSLLALFFTNAVALVSKIYRKISTGRKNVSF